jgi:hypothetical protein
MRALESEIYIQARMLATDEELCRMFNRTPERLERYRGAIERGKTAGMVALRYERAESVAKRGKAKGQQ